MDSYVASDRFAAETTGLSDGERKIFTVLEVSRTLANAVGFARTLEALGSLPDPGLVRIVWTIGAIGR